MTSGLEGYERCIKAAGQFPVTVPPAFHMESAWPLKVNREGNHRLPILIPQIQLNAGKTFQNCERCFGLQCRHGVVALLQMIIGYPGVQMVDMVIADIEGW